MTDSLTTNPLLVADSVLVDGHPIDFVGKSNLWIINDYSQSTLDLARLFIAQAVKGTAPGQLEIVGYDSSLTGLFAPFFSLSSGESRALKLVSDERGLIGELNLLKQQIQAVQNVIQGRSETLCDFRAKTGRPVEGYRLVVLAAEFWKFSPEVRDTVHLLMRQGPACGITFLVVSEVETTREGQRVSPVYMPNMQLLEPQSGNKFNLERFVIEEGSARKASGLPYSPLRNDEILELSRSFNERLRRAKLPTPRFGEIHDPTHMWALTSTDGLSFKIGKFGEDDEEIVLGDEKNQRHNMLITGAVGQGKSNLLSVIIHSLCFNYSPDELRLYLLDFKEGVTFKPFSALDGEDFLPHVETIGLESDIDFGLSVLDALQAEYKRRMKILKRHNARSVAELREGGYADAMPRIVVVIDEFQMMFGNDQHLGGQVVDRLESSIRLFRAAGIHFILSSQTLSGNSILAPKRDSIFNQVPIRIALKNSVSESMQTLATNNPHAAYLRPREAIVNLDYGELSQNRKTVIAFADEAELSPLRHQWWERSKESRHAPNVFEGEKRVGAQDAIRPNGAASQAPAEAPVACVGKQISIRNEELCFRLSAEPGHNIALMGAPDTDCDTANGILQGIALSLSRSSAVKPRILICDFTSGSAGYSARWSEFAELMGHEGAFVEDLDTKDFEETLKSLCALEEPPEAPIYLFGVCMDGWEFKPDSPFGSSSPLGDFATKGPARNMHFIGWWYKQASFKNHIGSSGDPFNTKVFLRTDENTVRQFLDYTASWNPRENRALAADGIQLGNPTVFVPYAPVGYIAKD